MEEMEIPETAVREQVAMATEQERAKETVRKMENRLWLHRKIPKRILRQV